MLLYSNFFIFQGFRQIVTNVLIKTLKKGNLYCLYHELPPPPPEPPPENPPPDDEELPPLDDPPPVDAGADPIVLFKEFIVSFGDTIQHYDKSSSTQHTVIPFKKYL